MRGRNETTLPVRRQVVWRRLCLAAAFGGLLGVLGWPGRVSAAAPGDDLRHFVVLLGAPASGKTTHGDHLSLKYGVPLVRAAEVLERAIKVASFSRPARGGRQPRRALFRLKQGKLVDDETLNGLITDHISQEYWRDGFIIDGYPNSVAQAGFLRDYLQDHGIDGLTVIYLDIPDEVALARMRERSRVDDKRGFGKERLRQFQSNISPLLEFYRGTQLLTVDTTKEESVVCQEIVEFINARQR